MSDRIIQCAGAKLFAYVLCFQLAAVAAGAQTTTPTTTTTTKPVTTAKPATAAKPVPAKPVVAAKPVAAPAAKVAVPTVARPAVAARPAVTAPVATRPAMATQPAAARSAVAAQPIPTRTPISAIAPGGKGGAIGSPTAVSATRPTAGTTMATPAGRAPIPLPNQPQAAVIPGRGNRAAIPLPTGATPVPTAASATSASRAVVPASSTSYVNPSTGRGRPPLPTYTSPTAAAPAAVAAGPAVAGPDGSLGTVQYGGALLTVYGCSRQGSQVACDADFNNQNQRQTQLNNGWWRDMYVVDQNGDRHERSTAYFVNPEGQPRETIDVPYGQSARYILVFNDVSPNVSMVSLHSVYGQLNIQNIPLDAAAAAASPGQAPGQPGAVGNAVSGTTDTLRTTGKQTASDAQQKAMGKGQDALQKLLNKVK